MTSHRHIATNGDGERAKTGVHMSMTVGDKGQREEFIYLFIYLFIHLFIYLFIYLFLVCV